MSHPFTVDELLALPTSASGVHGAEAARTLRCVALGPRLTLNFENRLTLLATLHSIMHTEGMTDRDALQAECDVYNTLLPEQALTAVLTVAPAPGDANVQASLRTLQGLEHTLFVQVGSQRHPAQFSAPLAPRQHVQFSLPAHDRQALGDAAVPVHLVVDLPNCALQVAVSPPLRRALQEDLA